MIQRITFITTLAKMTKQLNPIVQWPSYLLIWLILPLTISESSTPGQFSVQPVNQTVMIGDIVNFECRISSANCTENLRMYVNGDIQVAPRDGLINFLDTREYNATTDCMDNDTLIGRFWMFANNRTLDKVKHVSCRYDNAGITTPVSSERGHIIVESICAQFKMESPLNDEITNFIHPIMITDTSESKTGSAKPSLMPLFLLILAIPVTLMLCIM